MKASPNSGSSIWMHAHSSGSTPADSRVEVLDARIEWRPEDASTTLAIDVPRYFAEVLDA
jgi:hypothetical protein